MSKHQALKVLEQIERKAWNTKMNGSEVDACTIFGQEGKNELAWRQAADACRSYREAHDLLGLSCSPGMRREIVRLYKNNLK